MQTTIRRASAEAIAEAAQLLAHGGLVAFPTDTVYGLGARADNADAVQAIFTAKDRPPDKALIVHVRDSAQAQQYAQWSATAEKLAAAFWPGALTLVLPKQPHVLDVVTAGGETVAVRAPAHPVSIALLEACGFALAAPSANPSGEAPPTTAAEVAELLAGRIPLVLDGGTCPHGTPSTIVSLGAELEVLREGALPIATIKEQLRHP